MNYPETESTKKSKKNKLASWGDGLIYVAHTVQRVTSSVSGQI